MFVAGARAPAVLVLMGVSAALGQDLVWEARPGFTGFGPLAVANGVVVTGNTTASKGLVGIDAVHFASEVSHNLSALDLKTGKPVWTAEGPGFGSKTEVLVSGDRVYLAGEDGKARAFDSNTGKLLWAFPYSPGKGFCPTSISSDGAAVYFGGGEETYASSQGVFLWALDAATGKELWRFASTPESYSRIGECVMEPAVSEGLVAVTGSNILYALDATTGAVRWKQDVRRNVDGRERRRPLSAPHILAGRVYAIFEEGLSGWDLKDGSPTFEFAGRFPPAEHTRRLKSADGVLYFTANFEEPGLKSNRQGFLYALDPVSKQVKWKHRVNRPSQYSDPATWGTSEFAFAEGAVFYENYQFIAKVRR